ncbi:MAG: hypothetical protein NC417_08425 [Candidatus Gastranaerophilales bacterium]|nr:hypothetical protein [Candidatus Gastranaerophilales bacterium]
MKFDDMKQDKLRFKIFADFIGFTCTSIDETEKFRNHAAADVLSALLLAFTWMKPKWM